MTGLVRTAALAGFVFAQLIAQEAAIPQQTGDGKFRPTYVLGPGDQITIRAFEVEEISDKPFRIDTEGNINLPIIGTVHAGGLTVEQLEADLVQRLKTIVKSPQVVVSVSEFRSEPVFVTGYFKTTGIIPLQGRRTLLELLTSIGGVQPNASRRIKVTRHEEMGPIPLPNAVVNSEKKFSTVEISLESLRSNINPAEDIVLKPMDTISVDRAQLIYATGEVNKVGAVELAERDSISTTQLLAMVGGLGKDAAPAKARVLRQILDTSRRAEIPIDLKKILSGQASDFPLLPNDVLYVPRNKGGQVLSRAGLVALPMTSALLYLLVQKF